MPHQATDLERREAIEIRANIGRLSLNFRVQGRRILLRLDNVRDRGEDETRCVPERIDLQLPDPIHQDVGRAHGGPNQSSSTAVALHLKRLSHVAYKDAIQSGVESAEARLAGSLA